MDKPSCLIKNTEDGKLVVNPEAINILSSIDQPLVVVSIVGMYRTGKSYLMNKLARAQKGFNLGSTVQSKTKGIWMWCVPHPIEENHTLVLLDTEGLGDVEKGDNKNDICIFSLAVLLSSAMVYNSKGTIDQDAIDKLKFVGEISNLIKVKSHENEDEEAEFSRHFPIFIWTVRDFQLSLKIDGKDITEDEYLENALKLKKPVKTIRDEDYNRVRKQLRMYFGKRKCFVFDLPTDNKQHLKRLETVPDSDLNADFVTQSQKFCDYVFREADVKRMKGVFTVTGPRLGELVKIYTEAINSSKYACMEEAVDSLADKENKMAVQAAAHHYEDKMKEVVLPTEKLNQFLDLSRQYEDEARHIFLTRCFKDYDGQYFKEFVECINKQKNEFSSMNERKSMEICVALIRKLSMEFEKALANGEYNISGGHGKFKQDLMTIELLYNNEPGKGIKAEEVLQRYVKSTERSETIIIEKDNALSQREKQEKEENARKQIIEMEEKMKQLEKACITQQADEEMASFEETAKQLMAKLNEETEIMSKNINKAIEAKQRECDLYMKQAQKAQAEMYQAQIDDLQRKLQEDTGSIIEKFKKSVKITFEKVFKRKPKSTNRKSSNY